MEEARKIETAEALEALTAMSVAAETIGRYANQNTKDDSCMLFFAAVQGNEETTRTVGISGAMPDLAESILRAMAEDKDIRRIILLSAKAYTMAAPGLGLMLKMEKFMQDKDEPCNCPRCKAKREEAANCIQNDPGDEHKPSSPKD